MSTKKLRFFLSFRLLIRTFAAENQQAPFFMKASKLIQRALRLVCSPVRCNAVFALSMTLLGAVCVLSVADWSKGGPSYRWWWAELLVDVYAVCCLLMLFPVRARRWVRLLFSLIAYGVAVADVFCFVKFGSTLTPTMLLLVGETNSQETSEFFRSYCSWDVLLGPVGWVLLVAAVQGAAAVMLRRAQTQGRFGRLRARIPGAVASALRVLLPLLLIAVVGVSAVLCADNKQAYARLMAYDNIGSVEHELTRADHASLSQPLYRLAFSIRANQLTARQVDRLVEGLDRVEVDSCSFRSREIVLIIGESYNKRHSSLYGYDKETTPRQKALADEGSLVAFSDVIAPWNLTSFVFKLIFSTAVVEQPGDQSRWCDEPLFPTLFRKAGYEVAFLTNQFLPQAKEAVYDFSGGFFLNDTTLSRAMFSQRNHKLHYFDEGMLRELDARSRKPVAQTGGQLTIVHLKGQHVDYRTRCPKKQQYFHRADYQRPRLQRKELQDLAYYDNATRYNDSIVGEIVNRYRDRDAIVVYMPDHGEEVYNDDVHVHGRLHNSVVDSRLAHEEFDIPFWIWCSDSYRQSHPDVWQAVVGSSGKRYMTDALPHLLLYLAGIHTPAYRDDMNVLSRQYNDRRRRIIKGQIDYDEATHTQPRRASLLSPDRFFPRNPLPK